MNITREELVQACIEIESLMRTEPNTFVPDVERYSAWGADEYGEAVANDIIETVERHRDEAENARLVTQLTAALDRSFPHRAPFDQDAVRDFVQEGR